MSGKEVFNTGSYDIVLMELDENGFFIEEVDKFSLVNGEFVSKFFMREVENLPIVNLILQVQDETNDGFDLDDDEYEACMENYNFDIYKDIPEISIEERESYLPLWRIEFIYTSYGEVKALLEKILSIHREELERLEKELDLPLINI